MMKKKILCWTLIFAGGLAFTARSQTTAIPRWINFQSVLTDPAGNPLPDGLYTVLFSVVSAGGDVFYEEEQKIEADRGVVSAMVGEQGVLPTDIFETDEPRFLKVRVEPDGFETLLEIVSVPYAFVADKTREVLAGGVDTAAIQPKAITRDLLSDELDNALFATFQTSGGAAQVGVDPVFIHSQGGTVQTVLRDFDNSISQDRNRVQLIEQNLGSKVNRSGDTLSGTLNMDGHRIAGVGAPAELGDAVNKGYVDNLAANVSAGQNAGAGDVQQQLDAVQLQINAMPQIRAWASVEAVAVPGNPILEGSNNILSVERVGANNRSYYQLRFSDPVSTPYVVVGSAYNSAGVDQILSDIFTVIAGSKTQNGFQVRTITQDDPGDGFAANDVHFNLIVVK